MTAYDSTPFLLRLSVRAADARVELAASTLLDKIRHKLSISDLPLPLPIDQWIETPLGFDFAIVGDDQLDPEVLGLARPTLNQILIHESLLEHEGRFRFTCAHELGHCILHKSVAEELSDAELPRSGKISAIEHEADRFASSLLMPLSTLAQQLAKVMRDHQLNNSCVELLRGDDVRTVWLWRRCILPALCDTYGVSRAAMAYRFRELRLPGQRRILKPSMISLMVAPEKTLADLPLDPIIVRDGIPVLEE